MALIGFTQSRRVAEFAEENLKGESANRYDAKNAKNIQ